MNERVLSLLVQNALNATRTVQQPDEVGLEPEVLVSPLERKLPLPNFRQEASALVHDFEPEVVEPVFIHDFRCCALRLGDGAI